MTEKLYDKLEKGEIKEKNFLTLKKPSNVINLKDKPNFQDIKLKIDEINEFNSEIVEKISSRMSESSNNSLDCDIEGESTKCIKL